MNENYISRFRSRRLVGGGYRDPDPKLLRALNRAHEVRKFEIELYWKRAAYFWVFIAALFGAFGALILTGPGPDSASSENRDTIKFYLLCTIILAGFFASLAWYLVNRGSKYWQENWEAHVDALETEIEGPLYKLVIRPKGLWNPTSGYSFSVSRINILLSLSVTMFWLVAVALVPLSSYWDAAPTVEGWSKVHHILAINALLLILAFGLAWLMTSKLPKGKDREESENERLFVERKVTARIDR